MSAENFEFNSKLDVDFLKSIYEDDNEHAQIVFEKFMQTIGPQLNELEESYTSGSPEIFRKKIHTIKPVFSFVGLTGLTHKAEMIEKKIMEASGVNMVHELFTAFKNELYQMIPVIENDLTKLKALTL